MKRLIAPLLLAAMLTACATTNSARTAAAPAQVRDGVLADARGMTLYTFDKDPAGGGRSACNGMCAANWPPLVAPPEAQPAGDWSVVARDDGAKQWAFRGKPLYLWVKDQKPGDATGDGFNGVWHAVRP